MYRQIAENMELFSAQMANVRARVYFVVGYAFFVNNLAVGLAEVVRHLVDICQRYATVATFQI